MHLYALAWVMVLGLVWTAHRAATGHAPMVERTPARPWFFFCLGLVNITAVFVGVFSAAERRTPPLAVTILSLVLLDIVSLWLVWRWSGHGRDWSDRHRLALVAGLLTFFVYFSFDKDFEQWQGSSIVGVLTILGLWRLAYLVNRRLRNGHRQTARIPI